MNRGCKEPEESEGFLFWLCLILFSKTRRVDPLWAQPRPFLVPIALPCFLLECLQKVLKVSTTCLSQATEYSEGLDGCYAGSHSGTPQMTGQHGMGRAGHRRHGCDGSTQRPPGISVLWSLWWLPGLGAAADVVSLPLGCSYPESSQILPLS